MPSLFRRSNGIYYICYEDDGKRRWKSTNQTHRADALKELFQFEKLRDQYKTRTPLESFIKDFLAHTEVTWSQKTLEIYKRALQRLHLLVGNKLLTSITPKEVDLYRAARAKEVAPVSVNIDLRSLRAAFSTAVRWKLITENPFKKVPLLRVPDQLPIYFSKEDFQKFVSVIRESWFKDLVVVAVSTGLRRGELLNLKWEDVDFGRRLLHIHSTDSFKTKAGKRRAVPMNETVLLILSQRAQANQAEHVFTFNGRRVLEDLATKKFKDYVREVGINPKLHFHSLRHTFATWLVQGSVSIYEVQKLLGHSNISVTQVYSHLASSELHDAVEKISVAMN